MKDIFKQPTWVYFYVWFHRGEAIYVGQTINIKSRPKDHLKADNARGRFLREHQAECRYEVLDGIWVWDVFHGRWANGIENSLMDLYDTYFPETERGFNLMKAGKYTDTLSLNPGVLGGTLGGQATKESTGGRKKGPITLEGKKKAAVNVRKAYVRWTKENPKKAHDKAVKAGTSAHHKKLPDGRSIHAVNIAKASNQEKLPDGRSVNRVKGGEASARWAKEHPKQAHDNAVKAAHIANHVRRGLYDAVHCQHCHDLLGEQIDEGYCDLVGFMYSPKGQEWLRHEVAA